MMQAFIVTVRPGTAERYTDSLWVQKSRAEARAFELVAEFVRRGNQAYATSGSTDWRAWVTPITIEDAELGKAKP